MRTTDGSAGDADYGRIGGGYVGYRQPDPRIARAIRSALGDAKTVVNVGAGAGSYEPTELEVTPVEPSTTMRLQRPPHLAAAVDATAENLPFADDSFDAALATFTVHQWSDLEAGLAEMRRVARGPVVILSCDPARVQKFWLNDYAPAVLATEARRYPSPARIEATLGPLDVQSIPIPFDCADGFNEAYYGRPELLLDPGAREANSAWSFVARDEADAAVARLAADLASGAWDERYGRLRETPEFEGSLVLMVTR